MRAFLLFLSSLLTFFGLEASETEPEYSAMPSIRYSFRMEMSRGYLSGIFLTKQTASEIKGSVINEFGVEALSFRYDIKNEKLKLMNVIGFLDKWYIKKILRNDLRFCLYELYGLAHNQNRNYDVSYRDDILMIVNGKRNISYSFTPMPNIDMNNDTEQ